MSEEGRKKSLANLRPPIKAGEKRNPKGHNGARWMTAVRRFFKELDREVTDKREKDSIPVDELVERFRNVLHGTYRSAVAGNPNSQRLIIETLAGKAKETVEITGGQGAPQVLMYIPYNGRGPAPGDGLADPPPDDGPPEPSDLPNAPPEPPEPGDEDPEGGAPPAAGGGGTISG